MSDNHMSCAVKAAQEMKDFISEFVTAVPDGGPSRNSIAAGVQRKEMLSTDGAVRDTAHVIGRLAYTNCLAGEAGQSAATPAAPAPATAAQR